MRGWMCEPPVGDLILGDAHMGGLGREGPRGVATVWLQPFPPSFKREKCGSRRDVSSFGKLEIPPTAWRGSAPVFQTPVASDVAIVELSPPP